MHMHVGIIISIWVCMHIDTTFIYHGSLGLVWFGDYFVWFHVVGVVCQWLSLVSNSFVLLLTPFNLSGSLSVEGCKRIQGRKERDKDTFLTPTLF